MSRVEPDRPRTNGRDESEEWEPIGRPGRVGSRGVLIAVSVAAVLGIIAASVLVWGSRQLNPSGGPGPKVASVEVPTGASLSDVADILERRGVVGSATVMRWYAKFNPVPAVKAGRYVNFRRHSSVAAALEVLEAGPLPPRSKVVQIIPGMWLDDALARISSAYPSLTVESLKTTLASGQVRSTYHADPKASWEGYLLPETYEFGDDATAVDILQKIVSTFDETLGELGYDKAESRTGRTAADLVTIASMIERETGDPADERPKIARVILNRLEKGWTLGIDATLLYALHRKGGSQPLTKAELQEPGPYNTRLNKGLPPTAISLPSRQSLRAAIEPASGPWMYYVLTGASPRTHTFVTTNAEFAAAKKVCRSEGLC
ncbi:MAG: endolytic transglycosylase MltG [Microthrixaceae bacterium]